MDQLAVPVHARSRPGRGKGFAGAANVSRPRCPGCGRRKPEATPVCDGCFARPHAGADGDLAFALDRERKIRALERRVQADEAAQRERDEASARALAASWRAGDVVELVLGPKRRAVGVVLGRTPEGDVWVRLTFSSTILAVPAGDLRPRSRDRKGRQRAAKERGTRA